LIQVDGTTHCNFGGTGLGLTISREILILLDGGVTVESEEGKGTTFTFYIPMNSSGKNETISKMKPMSMTMKDAEPDEKKEPEPEDVDSFGAKILLVDDDIRNIYALTALLEQYECTVVSAENGKDALEKIETEKDFDLIVMDMMMPVMDGYTAMKEIRNTMKLTDIPIIALTAKAMPGDREKCINAGASDYISKPVNRAELTVVLRNFLKKGE